jgi:hypothetical protein
MKTSINFSPVKAIKLALAGFGFAVFLSPQHLAAQPFYGSPANVCNADFQVSLRVGPNQRFPVITTLPNGTPLQLIRRQFNQLGQEWSLVNTGGAEGFIPSGHVCS